MQVDPFSRKDWYDIKAPSVFDNRNAGKTLVNRSQGLSAFDLFFFNIEVLVRDLATDFYLSHLQRTPTMLSRDEFSSYHSLT